MKVLYLALGSQPCTSLAFKKMGIELFEFDFYTYYHKFNREKTAKEFLDKVSQIQPHWVHMQLQFEGMIDPDVVAMARNICPQAIFTNWSGDICKNVVQYFVDISKIVNYSFLSNTGQIPLYIDAGGQNIRYWQIGYNPDKFKPLHKQQFKYQVAFTANCYPDSQYPDAKLRKDIAIILRKKFGNKAGLFGRNYPSGLNVGWIAPSKLNDVYNDSVCVLSVSNFNDVEDYFSDRLLYCIASGRPTIVYRFPGLEKYFDDNKDIMVAHNINEIISHINKLNQNLELANVIGNNGGTRALEHTFEIRIQEMLEIIGLQDLG